MSRMKWWQSERIYGGVLWLSFFLLRLCSTPTRIEGFFVSLNCKNIFKPVVCQEHPSINARRIIRMTKRIGESSEESTASTTVESASTASRSVAVSIAVPYTYIYWFDKLNDLYAATSKNVRCPFFRRRFSDMIDALAMIGRFLIIRHKSLIDPSSLDLSLLPQVPGCLPPTVQVDETCTGRGRQNQESSKLMYLTVEQVAALVGIDWEGKRKGKGYYITGKLNTFLYENDCLFDGPDPDMPVRGLRKYLAAASHLFDHNRSYADLIDLSYDVDQRTVTARWKLGGVLMLPWRPKVKDWTGSTTYHINEKGLIYLHKECWDISVAEAFVSTVFPSLGKRIWG